MAERIARSLEGPWPAIVLGLLGLIAVVAGAYSGELAETMSKGSSL
jgi:hypothetical protein